MTHTGWIWLSNSRLKDFMRCQRFHRISWIDRRVPRIKSAPLEFGTAFGNALEVWEQGRLEPSAIKEAIEMWRISAVHSESVLTPYDVAAGTVLLNGYHAAYADDGLTTIGTEVEWMAPLVNPYTGGRSRTFFLLGHFDAVVRDMEGRLIIKERKTTSEDILLGSLYWDMLRSNPQAGMYFDSGAKTLDEPVSSVLFDVVRKPTIKMYAATPDDKRAYTLPKDAKPGRACSKHAKEAQATAKERGLKLLAKDVPNVESCDDCKLPRAAEPSRLYASMRDADETPEAFAKRLYDDVLVTPEKYFARKPIVRLSDEIKHGRVDTWEQAEMMRHQMREGHAPRNQNACYDFKRRCEYYEVCFGTQRLDDDAIFCDNTHPDRPAKKQ